MSVSFATICKFQRSNLSLTMDSKMISERGSESNLQSFIRWGSAPKFSPFTLSYTIFYRKGTHLANYNKEL